MKRYGLAIDQETNDLVVEDNSLIIVEDAEAVAQHARQRAQTFQGEWFLDASAGVPWGQQIFGRDYDPALAEAVLKANLLGTDGVTEITSFSVSFDRATRGLRFRDVEVMTDHGEVVSL